MRPLARSSGKLSVLLLQPHCAPACLPAGFRRLAAVHTAYSSGCWAARKAPRPLTLLCPPAPIPARSGQELLMMLRGLNLGGFSGGM